jgi:pimeloyl-ACP methyl ester carboxylesterase
MEQLRFSRRGAGASLVLIHGLGSSRAAWDPVVPQLAERFDVITPDLPGFGESEPLGPGDEPHPGRLAAAVAGLLDELHIDRPHLVGNSVGGWVSLELAALRPVSSVTLLSPAGLWPRGVPLYSLASLRITRWASLHAAGLLSRLVAHRLGRILVLGQTHGRPTHVTPDQARASIEAMRTARGFDAALAATVHRHYSAGRALGAPVTVSFGPRDLLLLARQSRHLEQLPPGTRTAALPGCGHVAMLDCPAAVVSLINASTAASPAPSERKRSGGIPVHRSATSGQ